jgi:type IV pilus assembly protein PilY1
MFNKLKLLLFVATLGMCSGSSIASIPIAKDPMFAVAGVPPVVMLNMSVDNQLFFNAYPEYADLDDTPGPDLGYSHDFNYFGYFDPQKCYSYDSTQGRFVPQTLTSNKYCSDQWSGNFLNWLTMARIDTVRKILYGGYRSTDDETLTVLERTYLPNDAHSWVRFYDGDDVNQLTPFSLPAATVIVSDSEITVPRPPAGERNDDDYRRTFKTPNWTSAQVQLGDQIELELGSDDSVRLEGVVRAVNNLGGSNATVNLQITAAYVPATFADDAVGPWKLTNHSRRGISFCNTTVNNSSAASQNVSDPPLLRVASGDYSLWTANERWQCRWENEQRRTGHAEMRVGGESFSNGNAYTASKLWANSENPVRSTVGLGQEDYRVRVEVCNNGLIGAENCRQYPNGEWKPIGLLQEFSDEEALRFGLMTGSFTNHVDGGVLRKNLSRFSDEINQTTGQFLAPTESIVRSLNALRIFGYSHGNGVYSAGAENCGPGTSKAQMLAGRCLSWGNPQAEIFAESLRYLAGLSENGDFDVDGTDRLPNLTGADWNNPVTEAEYCAPQNIIQFNASVTSYDDGAPEAVTNLPGLSSVAGETNAVGSAEGISGTQVFSGGGGFCEAATLTNLSSFRGICPEAPNQDGTYYIAGLAKYAADADLRPDWPETQSVLTQGVSLAPAVPRIEVAVPGTTAPAVVILPACDNATENLRCQLADFRIIEQDIAAGTGSFFIQWDVGEWGSDFDMDINGTLSYEITNENITVTTETWAKSSSRQTGFGYIISGTELDGFRVHSGINGYSRASTLGPSCNNCRITDEPTSWTYDLGGTAARLLREPLYYAAKYGGGGVDEDGEPESYFFAIDPSELLTSLRNAFQSVLNQVEAVTVTTSTVRLDAGAVIYEAGIEVEDWTGDVVARDPLTENLDILWRASDVLPSANSRNIFTGTTPNFPNTANATAFSTELSTDITDDLMAGMQALRPEGEPTDCGTDWFCVDSDALIAYLRGQTNPSLRARSTPIGTIVNSDTVLSLSEDLIDEGWWRLDGDIGADYNEFVDEKVGKLGDPEEGVDSQAVVLVGSNAGMLHAFSVATGIEQFAYVPSMVRNKMYKLANPDYEHEPFVDGRFGIADVWDGAAWKRVLVGGMGGGAPGLFALDVTDPQSFSADDVLWEIDPTKMSDSDPGKNIGHLFAPPVITRLSDGTFVAIFGNGVNGAGTSDENAGEVAELFVVDVSTGEILDSQAIESPASGRTGQNALMGVGVALSSGNDRHVRHVYAGDLLGHVWRFDIGDGSNIIGTPREFFRASVGQPITAPPTVANSVQGGWDVAFGTGQFFAEGDNITDTGDATQAFYYIRDINQTEILEPEDLGQARIPDLEEQPRRVVNDEPDQAGWMLTLGPSAEGGAEEDALPTGERVVRRATVGFGAVIVNTYEPSNNPCAGGGVVRLYVLDTVTGSGLLQTADDECGENCAAIELEGSGAPIAPPILISAVEVEDAVANDDDDGGEGAPPPILPDPDGLDRTAWCSRFGVRTPEGFQTLGTVCDGRQSWRQIF